MKPTQVAATVPFDNSSNGFVATDTQSAIEEAKAAADNLNNFVPEELWNSSLENYIPVAGGIKPFRVILKTEWLELK
jgi:hypothetical protein